VKVSFRGDGIGDFRRTCDDHNVSDGDGCSADCQRSSPGWYCPVPAGLADRSENPASAVDAGATCDEGSYVRPPAGNGVVDAGEECDDGILDGSYGGCTAVQLRASLGRWHGQCQWWRGMRQRADNGATLANTVARWLVPSATSAAMAMPTEISRGVRSRRAKRQPQQAATKTAGTSRCRRIAQSDRL